MSFGIRCPKCGSRYGTDGCFVCQPIPKPSEKEGVRAEEWWIGPQARYSGGSYRRAYDSALSGGVHVIEKSAYDSLKKWSEEQKFAINLSAQESNKLQQELLDCKGDLACALTDLSDVRREVAELKADPVFETCQALEKAFTQERARSKELIGEVNKILRDPRYTSQIAIAAWERIVAKHNSGKGG